VLPGNLVDMSRKINTYEESSSNNVIYLNEAKMARNRAAQKQSNNNFDKRNQEQREYLNLIRISPKTINQSKAFKAFEKEHNLVLHGLPGTGKTFISMYLALQAVQNGLYDKVVVIRSTVSARDMGFLPGNQKDKVAVYESPYQIICSKLYEREGAYEQLKKNKKIEFESTAFLRGLTLDDCVLIIDEFQNMSFQELHTIITRVDDNCRIILAGDEFQTDYMKSVPSGFNDFLKILKKLPSMFNIEFGIEDVVRSGFLKEYLTAYSEVKANQG